MDWSRAKSILIIILLVLNIFLLYNLSALKYGGDISKETTATAVTALKSKGIIVKCDIPRYNDKTARLVYEGGSYDRLKIATAFLDGPGIIPLQITDSKELVSGSKKLVFESDNTITIRDENPLFKLNISNIGEVERYIRRFIYNISLPVSEYQLDGVTKEWGNRLRLKFIERYKGLSVFDTYIEVEVSARGVTYLKYRNRKITGFTGDKKEILPAYVILLKNYNNQAQEEITDIEIGYVLRDIERGTRESYAKPIWRIKTADGGERYFGAYDGEEIKSQVGG